MTQQPLSHSYGRYALILLLAENLLNYIDRQVLYAVFPLIKADLGVEVAFAELGGWDNHVNEGASTGQLAARLDDLARGIGAFPRDLGDRMDDVVLLTMSEFGRAVNENGNRGTDHGHANVIFVLGGPVRGGKVYGRWPGMEQSQLYEGRDLAVTTDFRFITHAAERHAHEVAAGRFRDRLAERSLAHAGRTDQAQNRPGQLVGALLHGEILDDPLLDLLQAEVIVVEDLLR